MKNLIYVKGDHLDAIAVARRIAEERGVPLNTQGATIQNFFRFAEWVSETIRGPNPRVFFIGAPLLPAISSTEDDCISEIERIRFYMNMNQRNIFVCCMSSKNRMYEPIFMPEDGVVWEGNKEPTIAPMEPVTRAVDFDDIPEAMEPIGALMVADYEC